MSLCGALAQRFSVDGPLQSYVFVWSISPDVLCGLSSFKVMSLCRALSQMFSVDAPPSVMFMCRALVQMCYVVGPPTKLCLCVEHYPRGFL